MNVDLLNKALKNAHRMQQIAGSLTASKILQIIATKYRDTGLIHSWRYTTINEHFPIPSKDYSRGVKRLMDRKLILEEKIHPSNDSNDPYFYLNDRLLNQTIVEIFNTNHTEEIKVTEQLKRSILYRLRQWDEHHKTGWLMAGCLNNGNGIPRRLLLELVNKGSIQKHPDRDAYRIIKNEEVK